MAIVSAVRAQALRRRRAGDGGAADVEPTTDQLASKHHY